MNPTRTIEQIKEALALPDTSDLSFSAEEVRTALAQQFYFGMDTALATPAVPLPAQPKQHITAEEIGKIAMSLIGELTSDLADSDDEEEAFLSGTARGIGNLHAELLKLVKSKSAASPSPAPARPTPMESKLRDAVTILRGALVLAECAIKGREHTGFITKALTATEIDTAPFESAETAAPGAITEDNQ